MVTNSAIIVMNHDVSTAVLTVVKRQLFIDETMTGTEWDARVVVNPNYPTDAHLANRKLLITRPLSDVFDRSIVDLVLMIKSGLVMVESAKVGPPGFTLPLDRVSLSRLVYQK